MEGKWRSSHPDAGSSNDPPRQAAASAGEQAASGLVLGLLGVLRRGSGPRPPPRARSPVVCALVFARMGTHPAVEDELSQLREQLRTLLRAEEELRQLVRSSGVPPGSGLARLLEARTEREGVERRLRQRIADNTAPAG